MQHSDIHSQPCSTSITDVTRAHAAFIRLGPRLPMELCEQIIDAVADDAITFFAPQTRDYRWICQFALVCRSWLPQSRRRLYYYIQLDGNLRTDRFITTLSISPHIGCLVKKLEFSVPNSLPLTSNSTSSWWSRQNGSTNNWIYKAVSSLPQYLKGLEALYLCKLPPLHSVFPILCSKFTTIKELHISLMCDWSFCEIVRMANRFPQLRSLGLRYCDYKRPIHYSASKHKLAALTIISMEPGVVSWVDVLDWLLASRSTSTLTELSCQAFNHDYPRSAVALIRRKRIRPNLTLGGSGQPGKGDGGRSPAICANCHVRHTPLWRRGPGGQLLCNACGLFLKLHGVARPFATDLRGVAPLQKVLDSCTCTLQRLSLWLRCNQMRALSLSDNIALKSLHYHETVSGQLRPEDLSDLLTIAPASLEVIRISFPVKYLRNAPWEGSDITLSGPKFARLRYFEVEGTTFNAVQIMFPKSYLRGLLWIRNDHKPDPFVHVAPDNIRNLSRRFAVWDPGHIPTPTQDMT